MNAADRRRELLAGVTTFFTMAYIVVVNPAILSDGTGMPFGGVLTSTVLLCFSMTLFMGLYAKLPFALAPGMGLNAFFAYTVILGHGVPWRTALGLVFWGGFLLTLLSLTPLRERVAESIPAHLRTASAAGIGLFLAFIGLKNAGFIVADAATFVKLGTLDVKVALALAGGLLTVALMRRRSPFAFLGGILAVTLASWSLGLVKAPNALLAKPDFSTFLQLDLLGPLTPALLPTMLVIMMTDLFDSIATLVGVSQATGMRDETGRPRNLREGLIVDAVATAGSGVLGTSSGTTYIESAAGIEAGGRTGLTAVVCALCFLPCLFLAPLAGMVPSYATAPTLVIVGALMFRSVADIDFSRLEDALPAFLAVALVPLTFSITQGLLWGFVSHAALYTASGRARELSPATWAVSAVSAALLVLEHARF
jgi:adenine/guanine/hypoxanthine permease